MESFPSNITYWGAVVFEKWVKQCHENTFLHAKIIFVSWSLRRKLFSWHCFTHFSKTTAPQHVIFSGKLSTIIIFKLCKFSVNLWTLCFLSYKSYIDPLNHKNDLLTRLNHSAQVKKESYMSEYGQAPNRVVFVKLKYSYRSQPLRPTQNNY